MSTNPYESPETVGNAAPRPAIRLGTVVKWLIGGAILLAVVALLLPTVRVAREPARRSQCTNSLRQIALGLQNYHDKYDCFPPAYTVDANGKPLHSWRTLILPFIEHQHLYDQIDLSKPWDDPANQAAGKNVKISCYCCPSNPLEEGLTNYLAVVVPGGCFLPTESRSMSDITDGTSTTVIVVEVDAEHAVHWMSPIDADEKLILGMAEVESRKRPHTNGSQVVFADGHVQLLTSQTSAATRRALISIAGNDDVDDF